MAINKTKWGALACGLCCALCVALYLASVRGEVDAARAEALERYGGDQVEVCVAKRDLAAGEVVDASAVVTKMWVADLLPDTAVTDSSQIIGKRLGSNVIKGEVLCSRRTEMSDSELAVPAGMAAISVPARPVQAVGGSVEPGMEVDVYATGPVSTTKLVGGALVLATSAASESGATAEWVTLAVEPERVQEVVVAAQNLELYKENKMKAVITDTEVMGNENNLYFQFGGCQAVARVSKYEISQVGDEIEFVFMPSKIHFFDKETEMNYL